MSAFVSPHASKRRYERPFPRLRQRRLWVTVIEETRTGFRWQVHVGGVIRSVGGFVSEAAALEDVGKTLDRILGATGAWEDAA